MVAGQKEEKERKKANVYGWMCMVVSTARLGFSPWAAMAWGVVEVQQ